MGKYENDVKAKTIKEEIGLEQYNLLKKLKSYKALINTPQARLPFEIDFK